ncbi:hypothetical protein SI65_09750 [Aspergillus cristatus]|uniref:Heme haloperoxidase family profile domain-containing protein n=1 Tax=Aspergillus cristatus TaxID=573508 RepID=A0A1E3B2T0_ASPCR|nr:hypothetical protein SI65_09750 [Aspergillus cristatus]
MRVWKSALPLALLGMGASIVDAMPTADNLHKLMNGAGQIPKNCPYSDIQGGSVKSSLNKRLLVNSLKTPVDVTGDHAFQAPDYDNGDQRGPCPGLNALANHGYIPRSGIVSFAEVIPAINKVYGMGVDLATVLAVMGTVWGGNPLSLDPSFSIGGKDDRVNNLLDNLGGLLGDPQGIIGTHNFVESDSSLTRDDLYMTGNNYALNMTKFEEFYAMSTDGTFDMDLMAERAKIRMDQTKATNPNFYYGPVTGLLARNAGYLFVGRIFRNHSEEHPEGVLTKDIVKSFFAIEGEEGNFTYNEGWERIPDNWYKTPVDYGLVQLNLDTVGFVTKYPELGSIGGNTGTVNSFTGVDLSDLTGGVLNLSTLLEKNNLLCFVFEVLKFASPNALSGLYKTLSVPLEMVTKAIAAPLLNMTCPAFDDLKMGGQDFFSGIQSQYPGANRTGGGL